MALARRIKQKGKLKNQESLTEAIRAAEAKGQDEEVAKLLEQYQASLKSK